MENWVSRLLTRGVPQGILAGSMKQHRRFVARSELPAPADELYAWHLRPGAFERLAPAWRSPRVVDRSGPLGEGARVTLALPAGPLAIRWIARHTEFVAGRRFRDVQERGPFAHWVHTHRFERRPSGGSILEDEIVYRLPGGVAGSLLGQRLLRRELERVFAYRHAMTAADLERHRRVADRPALHVAISGASGLVGSALTAFLRSGGHRVSRIVRGGSPGPEEIGWDPRSGRIDASKLEGLDGVVHLAGESIAGGRWTAARRERIRASRVDGTRTIAEALARLSRPPRGLISASAVGFYGDRGEQALDESSEPGSGFLAETCRAWEAALAPAERAGLRVVRLRIGIVLNAAGGVLGKLLPPFRLGLGGRVGDGRQFMSWIALEDLVGAIHDALHDDSLAGAVNGVAPAPVTNAELTRVLAGVLRRPAVLPLPAPVVRLVLGQMGEELLLAGARVLPRRLEHTGFRFLFPDVQSALRHTLGRRDGPAWPEFSWE